MFSKIDAWLAILAISMLRWYQRFLSLDHGYLSRFTRIRTCRFHPSCSEYSVEAFKKYGFIVGVIKTCGRLLRCHPFNPGGYDPLK